MLFISTFNSEYIDSCRCGFVGVSVACCFCGFLVEYLGGESLGGVIYKESTRNRIFSEGMRMFGSA